MTESYITRPLDENGRVVIPKEIRRALKIQKEDLLEISAKNGVITMTKHTPGCLFCGETEDTVYFQGKTVCRKCLEALREAF